MIRSAFATIAGLLAFSLHAYDFSMIIENKTSHPFKIIKDVQIPETKISDVRYLSDDMEKEEITNGKYRYFVHLSLKNYIKTKGKDDVILFQNDTGAFRVKFSKPTSSYPYSFPVLLGDDEIAAEETTGGRYRIKLSQYNDAEGAYVVTIEDLGKE